MIQSIASSSTQISYGFENLSRFGAQASKQSGSSSLTGRADGAKKTATGQAAQLTPEQQQQVEQLKQIDRKVRQHEQAHLAAGRGLVTSGPNYTYQTGPDKQRYAVGGEVSIDTSPGNSPEETIPKAQHIRAAALAPADPSPQDNSVAAAAGRMEIQARIELAVQ
ncbi:MAG: putative metalloprotease CJM1_0395 family protein [Betaproteobacteria bacterium]